MSLSSMRRCVALENLRNPSTAKLRFAGTVDRSVINATAAVCGPPS
jgi:hypothetical protein